MQRSLEVLSYWFGSPSAVESGAVPEQQLALWFEASEDTDAEIRDRFGNDLEKAGQGRYDDWTGDPKSCLALIVLLDQFSRNIHRASPRAFAYDDRALACALDGIDSDHDRAVTPVARAFYYLPLEHAEDLGHQQRCVQLFEELLEDAPKDQHPLIQEFVDYAIDHRTIIERFGRFPHRNAILGRQSTPEEQAFLDGGGPTYGQTVT